MKSLKKLVFKLQPKYYLPVIILTVMFLLAFFSSRGIGSIPGDSAIVDEVAHIPSGYTYLKDLDYRLNPEHPPLAKALAAVPLVFDKNIKGPESDSSWKNIDQWDAGWSMLYHEGNNPKTILDLARLPMMLLMLGLGLLLYKWASELFGWKVGLVVLILYAFYPDILANGRLVTTDVPAAFGFVIATYFFDKALERRTWKFIFYAALAFGLAQLLKFSAFLLFAVFLILVVIRAILYKKDFKSTWDAFCQYFKIYFWVSLISLLVVWAVYTPFVWKTPPAVEHQLIETNLTSDPHTLPLRNFLHHFENTPVLRGLGHYLLGIMLVIGRVVGGNATYIMGHLSDKSISWYFPVAWLLKTPVTIILLFLSALVYIFARWPKQREIRWLLLLLITPWAFYWAFTLKGQLDIGIRHLLPTVPFVLMLIGYAIYPVVNSKWNWKKPRLLQIGLVLLLIYLAGSTVSNFPNFLAYFNEFTPRDQRYERLIDSSLDWGQDLLRLKKYVDDNHISSIKVDYFGGSVASYYIPQSTEWHANYGPTTGWIAVSATYFQSSKLRGPEEGKWSYDWLDQYKPKAIVGGSILVYDITIDDIIKNPPRSPYPILHPANPSIQPVKVGL